MRWHKSCSHLGSIIDNAFVVVLLSRVEWGRLTVLESRVLMMASLRLDLLSQVVVIDTCWPLQTSCESTFGFLLSDMLQDGLQPHSSLVWRFPDVFSS